MKMKIKIHIFLSEEVSRTCQKKQKKMSLTFRNQAYFSKKHIQNVY